MSWALVIGGTWVMLAGLAALVVARVIRGADQRRRSRNVANSDPLEQRHQLIPFPAALPATERNRAAASDRRESGGAPPASRSARALPRGRR